ncbi:MAG: DUF1800 domain-containing protein [Cyanobacteria bacterium J06607_15]
MLNQKDCRQIKNWLKNGLILIFLSVMLWTAQTDCVNASESLARQKHILSKLTFGITSYEREQVEQMGIEAYIQSQLKPQSLTESAKVKQQLSQLSTANKTSRQLQQYDFALRKKVRNQQLAAAEERKIRRAIRKFNSKVDDESVDAHLARAIYSHRQLQEVMVDFWFNHFNVNSLKGSVKLWINDYEDQIRSHALGNFSDLLLATAQHPAMLIYLDNKNNTAPESPAGKKHGHGLNENYAREVMELHTLGVEGGYSQDDIISLARIFTGWGIDARGSKGNENGFIFHQHRHDQQDKVFLGHRIAANGVKEGEQALQILANHPATAQHISYKLAQYFVADNPPQSLVDRLAKSFLNSRGNIAIVLDTLIHSQEFNDPQYFGQKFKTPYQYLVSLVRMGEIKQPTFKRIRGMMFQLSMPIYRCPTPDGYDNTQATWLNPHAMLQRTSLATAISNGVLNKDNLIEIQQLEQNMGAMSASTKEVLLKTHPRLRVALMLGSPEAMYR